MRLRGVITVLLVLVLSVPVFAASVDRMTDENSWVGEDGGIYTLQDGVTYKMVNGQLEYVSGPSQATVDDGLQSITDVMQQRPGADTPDANAMWKAQSLIGRTIGVALSVIMYIFFAMTFFTTACDLAYIGVPPIRALLYEPSNGGQVTDTNVQARRGRCLVSNELRSLLGLGNATSAAPRGGYNRYGGTAQFQTGMTNSNVALAYLKRRAVGVVLIVAVFMLLVTSTVFTDFGLNIGQMVYSWVSGLLGA